MKVSSADKGLLRELDPELFNVLFWCVAYEASHVAIQPHPNQWLTDVIETEKVLIGIRAEANKLR